MKTYRVVIERDSTGAWIARVPSVPGCHTYGRTLAATRRRIREALGLWVAGASRARLDFDVRLPGDVRRAVQPVATARRRARRAERESQRTLQKAARRLVAGGLSFRDAGELLGLSHQRIAQVVSTAKSRRPPRSQAQRVRVRRALQDNR